MSEPLLIAIDGPAASGKSTLARALARHYELPFLDTGLVYRAVARRLADGGERPDDVEAAVEAARRLDAPDLEQDRLRGEGLGGKASIVAAIPVVRRELLDFQRRFAADGRGSVLAGRDIGTVVCPHAPFKFFITASDDARACRRFAELRNRGEEPMYARVLSEIRERDRRDAERASAPMAIAEDADVIDTTELDAQAAFERVRSLIDSRLPVRR